MSQISRNFFRICRVLPRNYHNTIHNSGIITVNVPPLGESISEGSIATWNKSIGSSVAVDDVIAVIETDKVTVDIKSPYSGKIVELLGVPSSTVSYVNVGKPLYKIDVDDSASGSQLPTQVLTQTPSPKTSPPPQPQHISSTETTHHKTHPRGTPSLIQFVGKREHKKVEPTTTSAVASSSPSSPIQTNPTIGIWSSQQMAGYNAAWFGRPTLSPAEIEAIESGGASTLKF